MICVSLGRSEAILPTTMLCDLPAGCCAFCSNGFQQANDGKRRISFNINCNINSCVIRESDAQATCSYASLNKTVDAGRSQCQMMAMAAVIQQPTCGVAYRLFLLYQQALVQAIAALPCGAATAAAVCIRVPLDIHVPAWLRSG
jgi:hypothetical protein